MANVIVEALKSAMRGDPAPPRRKSDIEVITDALVVLALPDLQRAIPDAMRQAVATEQAKNACQEIIRDNSTDAAMTAFLTQQRSLTAQAATGKLDEADVWSLEDYQEDASGRARGAHDAWQQIDAAQAPVREQVVSQFLEIVNGYITEVETNDRANYERFGLNYSGSSLPALLRSTTSYIENRSFPLIVSAVK